MEQSPSWQGLPPESSAGTALLIFFASLACTCVALLGEHRPATCLGLTAACTLVLWISLRLSSGRRQGAGFTIDDTAGLLRVHGVRAIPFGAISSLRLVLYRDRACVQAMAGAFGRSRTVACVPPGAARDIQDALTRRGFTVRLSKNPFHRRTAEILPLLIMPLLAAALLYAGIDMYRRVPGLAMPSQQLSVEPAGERQGGRLWQAGRFAVMLPRSYRLIDRQPESLIFHSPAGDTRIAVDAGPDRRTAPGNALLQAVADMMGFGNVHDAALLAVRSRFGLMPAMIKAALLKRFDPETARTYRIQCGELSGVMLLGEQDRPGEDALEQMPDQVAEIMLRTRTSGLVIRMLIASRTQLDLERIKAVLSGIQSPKEP